MPTVPDGPAISLDTPRRASARTGTQPSIDAEEEAFIRVEAAREHLDYVLAGHIHPGRVEEALIAAELLLQRARLWLPVIPSDDTGKSSGAAETSGEPTGAKARSAR